jgi:hypothetical protein
MGVLAAKTPKWCHSTAARDGFLPPRAQHGDRSQPVPNRNPRLGVVPTGAASLTG